MPKTYEPISTQTVASAVASVTFGSIPQTYTDLVLITSGTSTGGAQMTLRLNGATSGYESVVLSGNGSSADGRRITGLTYIQLGYHDYFTGSQTVAITQINNYTNTNTHKTVLNRTSNAPVGVGFSVGLYANTSAITTFDALPLASTWATGTVFTLYGIKAA
jgi:hypothetical protein